MSSFYTYSYTETDIQTTANSVKELVINSLVKEGFIDKEKQEELLSKYAVVVVRKGWLGRTIDKVFYGKDDEKDQMRITFVKLV